MTDYKELVRAMRMCAGDDDFPCDCDRCPERDKIRDYETWSDYTYCVSALMIDGADAIEELLKAAKKMHTWIFLNTWDEQKAYDECGLTEEMKATLGYGGQFELRADPPKEEWA